MNKVVVVTGTSSGLAAATIPKSSLRMKIFRIR